MADCQTITEHEWLEGQNRAYWREVETISAFKAALMCAASRGLTTPQVIEAIRDACTGFEIYDAVKKFSPREYAE